MKISRFLLVASSLASSFFFAFSASAQTGDFRITTSPLPINLETNPGSTVSAQLKIKNDGIKAENIQVSLKKFKADSENGVPILLDREPGDDFFDWVKFSEDKFTLPSNEWKTITVTIDVPESAAFGYYYAVIFSRADENVILEERQTVIIGGTATMILLEVKVPGARKEVKLENFSSSQSWYEFLPATFNVKIRNTGNVHVAPLGNIFISKGGKNVATLEINPGKGSILPNSPREFQGEWTDGFPVLQAKKDSNGQIVKDEKGNIQYELKWNWSDASKLRWGKYTAKLVLVYDDGQRDVPIESEVSFWMAPWRVIIYVFVIVFLPAFFTYLYMKWRIRKIKKQLKN